MNLPDDGPKVVGFVVGLDGRFRTLNPLVGLPPRNRIAAIQVMDLGTYPPDCTSPCTPATHESPKCASLGGSALS
jgi:hypothetical protein